MLMRIGAAKTSSRWHLVNLRPTREVIYMCIKYASAAQSLTETGRRAAMAILLVLVQGRLQDKLFDILKIF